MLLASKNKIDQINKSESLVIKVSPNTKTKLKPTSNL